MNMIRPMWGMGRRGLAAMAMLLLALAGTQASAQTDDDDFDYNFDDIPVDDYKDLDYIGFGGGYLGMYSLLNYDELNAVGNRFGFDDFSGGMILNGGGGFIGGVGIKNLRFGIYGLGGSKEQTITAETYSRTMRLSNSLVAAQLDYAVFLPPDGLMLFPGAMIGRGSNTLELYQVQNGELPFNTVFNDDAFGPGADTTLNHYSRIQRNPIYLQPTLNLEYAFNEFIVLRLGGGYALNFGGTWTDVVGNDVSDVPDINANGFNAHLGLFVGLFQK